MTGRAPSPPAAALSTSIVVFRPDLDALRATLASLRSALERARDDGTLASATCTLVDNGSPDEAAVDTLVAQTLGAGDDRAASIRSTIVRGHGNVGYGHGHDLAIARAAGDYHLVLNPDVTLDPAAISEAVRYLETHPETGMVTPHVVNDAGGREFLCKRYPTLLVLALRGFAPPWLKAPFRRRLERYEMRDLPEHAVATGIPIATGCFMLARLETLRAAGGFSMAYFLYFEDFDLSLRLGRLADIAYVPAVRIVHGGGYAAGKGWAHRRLFLESAVTFFQRNGWRLW